VTISTFYLRVSYFARGGQSRQDSPVGFQEVLNDLCIYDPSSQHGQMIGEVRLWYTIQRRRWRMGSGSCAFLEHWTNVINPGRVEIILPPTV